MLQCIRSLVSRVRRRQRFHRVLAELQGYTDRELYELGIPPANVRRVARQTARATG